MRVAATAMVLMVWAGCDKKQPEGQPPAKPSSGESAGKAPAAPPGSVLIGEFGSLTGSEATFGQSTHNGIMLALKEVNGAGGITNKGKTLAVKVYDDQGRPQEAGTAVTRLITDDKVTAVLGEVASSLSIAGGRVAQQYHVPMITPSSTNPQVTQIGDMIFRVCFLDDFQGWVEAKFARDELKAKKAALLYDQAQAYSKGLKDFFKKSFTEMGGTIATEQAFSGGDQDFSAQLTTIRDANVDVILVPGYYTDVGNIILQARKLGIKAPFLGGDGWRQEVQAGVQRRSRRPGGAGLRLDAAPRRRAQARRLPRRRRHRQGHRRDQGLPRRHRRVLHRRQPQREEVGRHRRLQGLEPALRDHHPAALDLA